jgi:hypothetical protein
VMNSGVRSTTLIRVVAVVLLLPTLVGVAILIVIAHLLIAVRCNTRPVIRHSDLVLGCAAQSSHSAQPRGDVVPTGAVLVHHLQLGSILLR